MFCVESDQEITLRIKGFFGMDALELLGRSVVAIRCRESEGISCRIATAYVDTGEIRI